MPINVTVANSRKMPQLEKFRKIVVFALAASRLNSKVYFFPLRLSRTMLNSHWSHTKRKID